MASSMAIASAIAIGVSGLTGCYRYVPVSTSPDSAGTAWPSRVRLDLTDAGVVALSPLVGSGVVAVEGRVTARRGDTLLLAMSGSVQRSGAEQSWAGEPATIALRDIESVRTRERDVFRSVLVGTGIVAGALLAARLAGIDFSLRGTNRGASKPAR